MRCKVGDLVVIVRTAPEFQNFIGRICRILGKSQTYPGQWEIDIRVGNVKEVVSPDEYLRPIRDNDGEDEMLRIAGRPQPVVIGDDEGQA